MGKKSFLEDIDPLDKLIDKPQEQEPAALPEKQAAPPAGYKYNPLYVETRSKRAQFLLKPSTVTKLKAKATGQGRSVNDLVNEILEAAVEE